jgi:hypothetical protein
MSAYPKTENLLLRDEVSHKLIPGAFREEAFEQVARWQLTEKIDGTNIRLVLPTELTPIDPDGTSGFSVRGRTDAATLPKGFIESAVPYINAETMLHALRVIDPEAYSTGMIVYGEGYGPGIQKGGGAYADRKTLAIFDVVTLADDRPPLWRRWADVEAVAHDLGLETAPVLADAASMDEVFAWVRERAPFSTLGDGTAPFEGVVARTDPYLYTARGNRVKFKLKVEDLA